MSNSLQNLSEGFVYDRLPSAVISFDERGLIAAVLGGFQDRLEDLRSYGRKMESFYETDVLPDGEFNVVLVDVTSDQGIVYTRSLEFTDDVPADSTADLLTWAAIQLSLPESRVANARYGRDLLRLVEADTLERLAETIGAVLYQSVLLEGRETEAHRHMVATYFPRLRIKGTAQSYEVLGRLLGLDDVAVIPQWSRLSVRDPRDVGSGSNVTDFASEPEYYPRQQRGPQYDPHVMADGPFYAWSGTCVPQVADTRFYTQVINGNSPFVRCTQTGIAQNGSIQPLVTGDYVLAGGAPHAKASVTPDPGDLLIEAIAPGASFNGMTVHVISENGSQIISIEEQLSAIKYRSSYFDLGLFVNLDEADTKLGSYTVKKNTDLAAGYVPAGEAAAVSPYRPWKEGTLTPTAGTLDWLQPSELMGVSVARTQATALDRQLNADRLAEAQAQLVTAFEEVRPATRFVHDVGLGYVLKDDVNYACYESGTVLFSTQYLVADYAGAGEGFPAPGGYRAQFVLDQEGTLEPLLSIAIPATNSVRFIAASGTVSGTYNFDTNDYTFHFANPPIAGKLLRAVWEPLDTEFIRSNPGALYQTYVYYTEDSAQVGESTTGLTYNEFLNWDVTGAQGNGSVDLQGTDSSGHVLFPSTDASNTGLYVDLISFGSSTENGTITTKSYFDTYTGRSYRFNFDVSGNNRTAATNDRIRARVIATSGAFLVDVGTTITDWQQPFQTQAYSFAGTTGQAVRLSLSQEYHDNYALGNFVDNIALWDLAAGTVIFEDGFDSSPTAYTGHNVLMSGSATLEVAYQARPEDQLDEETTGDNASLESELMDDSGVQYGILSNGALVDLDLFDPRMEADSIVKSVTENTVVMDQAGVPHLLYAKYSASGVSAVYADAEEADNYSGYPAIAYSGSLKDLSILSGASSSAAGTTDGYLDQFNAGYSLYIAGAVNSVLVADPDRFNSPAHRDSIVFWLPLNEQTEDSLTVREATLDGTAVIAGIRYSDRTADADQGWALKLRSGATVSISQGKSTENGLTASFWCSPSTFSTGEDQLLLEVGALRFTRIAGNSLVVSVLLADGTYTTAGTLSLVPSAWNFVCASANADQVLYGLGSMAGAVTLSTATIVSDLAYEEITLALAGGTSDILVRDVRVWVATKTQAELNSIRDYAPVAVQVPYPVTQVTALNRQSKYGLKALTNHWLAFDTLPAWVKGGNYARVIRYNGDGRYAGAPSFDVTGLQGDSQVCAGYTLGAYANIVDSSGTYVTATQPDALSEEHANAAVQAIWVTGTNSRYEPTVYRVFAQGAAGAATLLAEELSILRTDVELDVVPVRAALRAGATYDDGTLTAVPLNGSIAEMTVTGGSPYQIRYDYLDTQVRHSGKVTSVDTGAKHLTVIAGVPIVVATSTGVTAPVYLYADRWVALDAANAYDTWLDRGASPEAMGVTYTPSSILDSGTLTSAVIGKKGALEFECTGTLSPGSYELELVTGNVGQVDRDYDGFNVEINLNENVIQRTLLKTYTGADFSGTEVFALDVVTPEVHDWIMSLQWFNPAADTARGTVRQFAVYSYKLTKLETKLYSLDISGASPALTEIDMDAYTATKPGGWLFGIQNSSGTLPFGHEGTTYPQNDTGISKVTLNEMLTGCTCEQFDDLYFAATNIPQVPADEGTLVLPTFGALSIL